MAKTNLNLIITITIIFAAFYIVFLLPLPINKGINMVYSDAKILNLLTYKNEHINTFSKNKIIYIENIFTVPFFKELLVKISLETKNKKNTNALLYNYRKAGIISPNDMKDVSFSELYTNKHLINFISEITSLDLHEVDYYDPSKYSILIYDTAGDHITWHNDPNHFIGNRITVLFCIFNENEYKNGLSNAELEYVLPFQGKFTLKMKPNSILIFDGSVIKHRATGVLDNEYRVLLSHTYCDVCKETFYGRTVKYVKEKVLNL